jgi:hypothetical protein
MARVQASFAGVEFWALSSTGPDGRRIVKHQGWGRVGASTEDTGSDGRHERITAQLTKTEYDSLRKLCHEAKVRQFQHPLLGSWRARINIPTRTVDGSNTDLIDTELEFIEDTDQPPASPYDDETPQAKKTQAKSLYDDSADTMGGTPGDSDTQILWTEYAAAWALFDEQTENYDDTQSSWQDVEKALDACKVAGWAVIDNLGAFTTYQEGASEVCSQIARTLAIAHDYIWSIRQMGVQWFNVQVDSPTDVFTLCLDLYDNCDNADAIIDRNDVLDSFYLPVGTVLECPVP